MGKPGEKYQPSSGTEGMFFTDQYCMNCLHCDPDPDGEKQCDILCRTMVFDTNDEEYPKEWTYKENGQPFCTSYVHWNWQERGNPDEAEDAPVISNDPDQLGLFD